MRLLLALSYGIDLVNSLRRQSSKADEAQCVPRELNITA